MENKEMITKKDIENMKLLTDEEISKLSFDELCMYLSILENAKEILERGEE